MFDIIFTIFDTLFLHPIINLLLIFYKIFLGIGLPGAFGLSIITLTLLIRFALHPFFKQSMELSRKMQELKPQLEEIQKKHKKEPKTLQQEQLKLYQQSGVNPASGCVFALIQIPIFLALYRTLNDILLNADKAEEIEKINSIVYSPLLKISEIDPSFLGLNLALPPSQGGAWYYYLIPVVTAGLQFIQAQHMPGMQTQKKKEPEKEKNSSEETDGKKKSSTSEDFQKALGMQMRYFFPIMLGWLSYTLPLGLSLYWNIFSIFSIIQHRTMNNEREKKTDNKIEVKKETTEEEEKEEETEQKQLKKPDMKEKRRIKKRKNKHIP